MIGHLLSAAVAAAVGIAGCGATESAPRPFSHKVVQRCEGVQGVTVELSGWPEGAYVYLSIDNQPPRGLFPQHFVAGAASVGLNAYRQPNGSVWFLSIDGPDTEHDVLMESGRVC